MTFCHPLLILLILLLPAPKILAADKPDIKIDSCTLTNPNFGQVAAGNSPSATFGVKTNTPAGTIIGNDGKMIATGNDAVLTINTRGGSNTIKVFLTTSSYNMSGGGSTIPTKMSFSNSSADMNSIVVEQSGSNQTVIPIYGYSTIGAEQNPGNYSGNYQIAICICQIFICLPAATEGDTDKYYENCQAAICPSSAADPECDYSPTCLTN